MLSDLNHSQWDRIQPISYSFDVKRPLAISAYGVILQCEAVPYHIVDWQQAASNLQFIWTMAYGAGLMCYHSSTVHLLHHISRVEALHTPELIYTLHISA